MDDKISDLLDFGSMAETYEPKVEEKPADEPEDDSPTAVRDRLIKATNKKVWIPIPVDGEPTKILVKEIGEASNQEFFKWLTSIYPPMKQYEEEMEIMTRRDERLALFETVLFVHAQLSATFAKYGFSKYIKDF